MQPIIQFLSDNALLVIPLAAIAYGLGGWLLFRDVFGIGVKAIGQFILLIGLPVLALFGLPVLWVAQNFGGADERVLQALIAGTVIVAGWLTTSIYSELSRERDRQEKIRDVHRAIFAEIRFYIDGIPFESFDDHLAEMTARMTADADFVPLVPSERGDHFYSSIIEGIQVLPRETIDPIVSYYGILDAIRDLADLMQSDQFREIAPERRIGMYRDFIELKRHAYRVGKFTLGVIAVYAKEGGVAARRHLEVTQVVKSPTSEDLKPPRPNVFVMAESGKSEISSPDGAGSDR